MRPRFIFPGFLTCALAVSALAGDGQELAPVTDNEPVEEPFKFSGEFEIDQAFLGNGEVARGRRTVNDFDEYYSNLLFVYTPRVKYGILRLGAQWERYSFDFPHGGQQLPNTLQATNTVIGFDTKFSDSILVRIEAQPGFYGTTFDHLDGDSFNIPFVLGGTYIFNADFQLVLVVGVNVQSRYPVLPGGGIRWRLSRQWVLNFVLPKPRLEFEAARNLTLYAGGDFKTNSFRVDDQFGNSHADTALNSAWLDYEEIRVAGGLEWKLSSSISFNLEAGYAAYRQFDFHRTEVRYHHESGSPYGAIMLHGEF